MPGRRGSRCPPLRCPDALMLDKLRDAGFA